MGGAGGCGGKRRRKTRRKRTRFACVALYRHCLAVGMSVFHKDSAPLYLYIDQ